MCSWPVLSWYSNEARKMHCEECDGDLDICLKYLPQSSCNIYIKLRETGYSIIYQDPERHGILWCHFPPHWYQMDWRALIHVIHFQTQSGIVICHKTLSKMYSHRQYGWMAEHFPYTSYRTMMYLVTLLQNPGLKAHNSFDKHVYNSKYNKVSWNEIILFFHK